ncbi:glycosyltransferase family 2 protein [Aestuariibaculum sp. M13]|uniref:glycosyltransferase family 2 protein n=1 Tax=Aestuariibaculum sp. M13 TaxID=2967132 RepID=UPI002159D93F|nr:glycosyltransferase family A protein [Aestuariibaculum sp. M13]MCR8666351.1 glycosyltransferase family 2 protein [Aestuariibaculum sp. M13]
MPQSILKQLNYDSQYSNSVSVDYDLSWQAIQKGYIGEAETYKEFENLPIIDNYRFIRKYFSPVWVFYVLFLRILLLCNPYEELRAYIKTFRVKRLKYQETPLQYSDYNGYDFPLLKEAPFISVIIPTLNRYDYLKVVLKDFESQDYSNFEIIVVDQSEPFDLTFYREFNLNIRVIHQMEKALWLARNTAIKVSEGEIIALSEDDVRIQSDWLSQHIKCLDYFKSQVSAGVFYPLGYQLPKERSYFAKSAQFATGNAMLYKNVFQKVGLFDRQFEKQRMGDGEFGMRLYLEGVKSVSNPLASCVDIKANVGGLRELGSWDAFRPKKWFAPRPIPSVLYFYRRYFGNTAACYALLRTVPMSVLPYRFKKNKPLLVFGVILTVLFFPFVCGQVFWSWCLSSKKLKEGPLIEHL